MRSVPWATKFSIACALSSAVLVSGCNRDRTTSDGPVEFSGRLTTGEYVALRDFRGQVVLANVWATWCPPCKKELPELARLHRAYAPQKFTVLGVNVDAESFDGKVQRMVQSFDLPYPNIRDPRSSSTTPFGVRGYPTSVLLDGQGAIIWRRIGEIRPNDPELSQAIEGALQAVDAASKALGNST